MKKAVSIFLLGIYLLSTTPVDELLKLPVLMEHYVEHKALNQSISFLEFLDMHYMHGSPRDSDYDRDMQLPFKTLVQSSLVSVVYTVPAANFFNIERPPYKVEKKNILRSDSYYSFNYLSSIWQPPRVS